ncbi:MAG: hypothetical protein HZB13_05425 [Acidobacteria bacterium]|nr:hypothetical protein [Acidobacteriota bacterium]
MKPLAIVLAIPVLAFARDGIQGPAGQSAGETARSQSLSAVSSTTPDEFTPRHIGAAKYLLPPKKIEAGALFGRNGFSATMQAHPSLGGAVVLGLDHGFGIFGEGAWNRILGLQAPGVEAKAALYDLGGGMQWNPFHWGRFSPYLRGGLSWVHVGAGGRIGSIVVAGSTDRLGANLGFGGRIHLAEHHGVLLDFRLVQGPQAAWLARFSTGLFYHFK